VSTAVNLNFSQPIRAFFIDFNSLTPSLARAASRVKLALDTALLAVPVLPPGSWQHRRWLS
jgi:hypothetical protein